MKVLVTGSAGLPGNEVIRLLEERGIPCLGVDTPELDLADAPSVRSLVAGYTPDVIVHCAGWTDADKAESYRTVPGTCDYYEFGEYRLQLQADGDGVLVSITLAK